MFHFHKCICNKVKEQEVYNTKEVQELYQKVYEAANTSSFLKQWNYDERTIHKHHESFSMKLSRNAFSLFLVPVVIEQKTYQFIIDSGAQISGIVNKHTALIEKCRKSREVMIRSASGKMKKMSSIVVERMFLGTVEIEKQPMVILDENDFKVKWLKKDIMNFDGIIGWDILSELDFELDGINQVFSLVKCKEIFTYCNLIHTAFPIVIVYDENHAPALFGIDSGANESWLWDEYAKHRELKKKKAYHSFNIGVHGMEKVRNNRYKKNVVGFSKHMITLENVKSGQTQVFDGLSLDGIFGNEIFRNKKIQFLNSKGIVRLLDEK